MQSEDRSTALTDTIAIVLRNAPVANRQFLTSNMEFLGSNMATQKLSADTEKVDDEEREHSAASLQRHASDDERPESNEASEYDRLTGLYNTWGANSDFLVSNVSRQKSPKVTEEVDGEDREHNAASLQRHAPEDEYPQAYEAYKAHLSRSGSNSRIARKKLKDERNSTIANRQFLIGNLLRQKSPEDTEVDGEDREHNAASLHRHAPEHEHPRSDKDFNFDISGLNFSNNWFANGEFLGNISSARSLAEDAPLKSSIQGVSSERSSLVEHGPLEDSKHQETNLSPKSSGLLAENKEPGSIAQSPSGETSYLPKTDPPQNSNTFPDFNSISAPSHSYESHKQQIGMPNNAFLHGLNSDFTAPGSTTISDREIGDFEDSSLRPSLPSEGVDSSQNGLFGGLESRSTTTQSDFRGITAAGMPQPAPQDTWNWNRQDTGYPPQPQQPGPQNSSFLASLSQPEFGPPQMATQNSSFLGPLNPYLQQSQMPMQNSLFLHTLQPCDQQPRRGWSRGPLKYPSQRDQANSLFLSMNSKRPRRDTPSPDPAVKKKTTIKKGTTVNPFKTSDRSITGISADSTHTRSDIPSHSTNRAFLTKNVPDIHPEDTRHAGGIILSNPSSNQANTDQYPVYEYSPLSEHKSGSVRLIKFAFIQNNPTETYRIRCELVEADSFQDQIDYICLSYCWGDGGRNQGIYIKGENESDECYRSLLITENLHAALKSLQASDTYSTKLMWIDMISINQNDLHERGKQVALMKNIYDNAAGVVVWLGNDSALHDACPVIHAIYESFLTETSLESGSLIGSEGLNISQEHLDTLQRFTKAKVQEYTPLKAYELLAQFFSLPWFRRVWVLQEASSHRTVTARLGEYTLPFESIIVAALWQSFLTRSYTSLPDTVLNHTRSDQGYLPELWLNLLHTRMPRGLSIVELVCRARDFRASDPRDKLFAMLGLAHDIDTSSGSLPPYLQPDYTMPKEIVYMRFAKGVIETSRTLDILSAVDTFTGRANEMCSSSWMPHLDVPIATIRGLGFPRKYNAAYGTEQEYDQTTDANDFDILSLCGIVVDAVGDEISTLLTLSPQLYLQIDSHANAVAELWVRLCARMLSTNHLEKFQKLQAFINTLTAAGFAVPRSFPEYPLGQVEPPQNVPSIIVDFAAYWARFDLFFKLFDPETQEKLAKHAEFGDADQFAVLAGKACHERRFFFTEQSRMGLCPRDTQPGDKIAVLYGGSVPYVVRENSDGTCMLVGECYVDGLMFGKARELKESFAIADQVFRIR